MAEPVRIVGGKDNEGIQAQVFGGGAFLTQDMGYVCSDIDKSGDPYYFGFVDKDGRWFIMSKTSTAIRYVSGQSAYTVAWAARALQSYGYRYAVTIY